MPDKWQRLTRATLPGIEMGNCWFTTGEHSPNEERKHLTDALTLQRNVAIYGDSLASWWRKA